MAEQFLTVDFRRPDDETIEVWVIPLVGQDRLISTHTYDGIGWSGLAAMVDTTSAVAITLGARVRGGTVSEELPTEPVAEPETDGPWAVAKVSGLSSERVVSGSITDGLRCDSLELSGPPEMVQASLAMLLGESWRGE